MSHCHEWEGNAGSFNLGLCVCVYAASTLWVHVVGLGGRRGGGGKVKNPVIVLWKIPFYRNVEHEGVLPVLGITVRLPEIIKGYKCVYVHSAYLAGFVVG